MNKKIISIFVSMLLFVTVFSVTGAMNVEKDNNLSLIPKPANVPFWEDDFDDYTLYQYLDGGPDDGGWEPWAGAPTAGAYVTNNQSRSTPHSVEIVGIADLVHKYSQVSSGNWTYATWQYIPEDFAGETYFIMCDWYEDGGATTHWAVQLRCSSIDGLISSEFGEENLPLILGEWVEIRVEIDFGADEKTVYYGGEELVTSSWTAGMNPDGNLNLGCVDLWSNGATYVYYDDFTLEGEVGEDPDLFCEGALIFGNVSAGATLTGDFTIFNSGGGLLGWNITKNPSWGTWTFDPEEGDDLASGDSVIVQVTVIAPEEKDDFAGTIKVENKENPDDNCLIDVSMTTPVPVNQPSLFLQFLERLIQRFPVLELIFSHLLG